MPGPELSFEFRALTETEVPLLFEWLQGPHLAGWWAPESSVEDVREKYLVTGRDAARPFIAYLDGEPIGYIQYYLASEGPDWWPDAPGPGVLGIDQFLADGDRLDRGLGTAMVSQFVASLLRNPLVTEIRVDPHPDNARAIRCYEKAGFKRVAPIVTPDGPALMMILRRPKVEVEFA